MPDTPSSPANPATPSTPTAPAAPEVEHAAQSKAIANYANAAKQSIQAALNDATLVAALSVSGYDATALNDGLALAQTLVDAYATRQEAMGGVDDAQDEFEVTAASARGDYAAYRKIARAAFPKQGDRVGLGLTGDVPHDFQRFLTTANTSYVNSGKDPWKTKMTLRGYGAARLTTLIGNLVALGLDKSGKSTTEGEAEADTKARNDAYDLLRAWMKEFAGVARGVFHTDPAQLAKLKLKM